MTPPPSQPTPPPPAEFPVEPENGRRVSTTGRRGACIEENAGWERRIGGKVLAGVVVGIGAGAWLAVFRHRPLLRTAAATSASVAVTASLYGASQETLRVLTCQDGPVNSVFAGGISGWALGLAHHGPGRGPKAGALLFASAGALCHTLDARGLNFGAFAQWAASSTGLIERPATDSEDPGTTADPWYVAWLPIRKLDPDEYDNFHAQQELKNSYGTGEIEQGEYEARLSQLQVEAFMRKKDRMEKGEKNRHSAEG